MKKILFVLSLALANFAWAQFTTSTVNLGSTGMTVKMSTNATKVTLTLTGDSNSMLGIGFGANANSGGMANGTDGFIYNSSTNRDYAFTGMTAPTADPSQDWTVTSNTVSGSTRTISATRNLSSPGDFTFINDASSINIFYARTAGGQALAYHGGGSRGYAVLTRSASLATGEVVAESKKIMLYPNPAKETVMVKNFDRIKSIDIYEVTGRKVKTVKMDGQNINISDLKSGSYYLEIALKDGTSSYEKLIKE